MLNPTYSSPRKISALGYSQLTNIICKLFLHNIYSLGTK